MSIRDRYRLHRICVVFRTTGALLLCAAFTRALTPIALAQGGVPATSSVLGEVYRGVERSNPRSEAARALARAAQARVPSARRPPDPQLQLGFMNYDLAAFAPMPTLGMAQLQFMQMVPIAGKLGLAGRVAEAQASAESERASDVRWEVRTQAAMAFYDLYAVDQSLVVARETLRLLQDIAKTAESMYRVGEGRQADALRAQVEIARMTEDTIRMRTMRTGMTARLNALLNRGADAVIATPALPAFPDSLPALESLQEIAQAGRPMIRAGREVVQASDAVAALARRELFPDLQVGLQYGQRGGMTGTDRMGSLMLGATLPIFARSRQLQMREEAAAMRAMADADLAAMRATTRGGVAESFADLARARNLALLYRNTVLPQANATVASALAAYRVGAVDFMTLLDDQMMVNKYRQEQFTLEAEQGKSWAELEMFLGRELFDPDATLVGAAGHGGVR